MTRAFRSSALQLSILAANVAVWAHNMLQLPGLTH
jgi:hypothetical protein